MRTYHIAVTSDSVADAVMREIQTFNLAPEVHVSKSFGLGQSYVVIETTETFDEARLQTSIESIKEYMPEETPTANETASEPTTTTQEHTQNV